MPRRSHQAIDNNAHWYLLHARLTDVADPYVWRQFLVPPNLTLDKLHCLMQAAFGWSECHMHSFDVKSVEQTIYDDEAVPPVITKRSPEGYRVPCHALGPHSLHTIHRSKDDMDDFKAMDLIPPIPGLNGTRRKKTASTLEAKTTICELDKKYDFIGQKAVLMYEYDFGDSWEHVIMVEKTVSASEVGNIGHNLITGGGGHGVAEDSGASSGWEDLKLAYKVKGTKKDDEESAELREWYEEECYNGDKKGLKGKARLEQFSVRDANDRYDWLLDPSKTLWDTDEDASMDTSMDSSSTKTGRAQWVTVK